MLNLFQPLPSQAIFSRDPCPLALGSKRALPPLPFFPDRVEAFLFLSFFFSARDTSMPRSKCRWWDHSSSYENASLPPAVAGITLPRFARLVPTREDRDTRVHPDLVRYSNVSCFYSGIFVRSTSLLHGKLLTRNGKKQGIFSCRKLSILRWLYFVGLRRKMRLQFLEHWFRNYTIYYIFVILPEKMEVYELSRISSINIKNYRDLRKLFHFRIWDR